MRPILPPRFGLLFALLFAAVPIVFFGFTYMHASVQAQDDAQVEDALVTADAGAVADGFDDLVIGIVNSVPIYTNETVTFSATVNIEDISGLTFRWQFGDGQSAEGRDVSHIYEEIGDYTVRLFVASSGGQQKEATKDINVQDRPGVTPVPPKDVAILILDADPNNLEAQTPYNFLATVREGTNLQYSWDFGDGSPGASGSSVTHSYGWPGTYRILVTATGPNNKSARGELTVVILNAPPENVSFSYTPDPAFIGSGIAFTAKQSRGTNLQYKWVFSDGSAAQYGQTIGKQFRKPGLVEVRVTAWNGRGTEEYSRVVPVNAAPPSSLLVIQNGPKNPGEPVTFVLFVNSQAPIKIFYRWGDRGRRVVTLPDQGPDNPFYQHTEVYTYREALRYPFTVTVANDFGLIREKQIVYIGRNAASEIRV
nr:PKD domain-containing protein [Caldilineaceae bacterium]